MKRRPCCFVSDPATVAPASQHGSDSSATVACDAQRHVERRQPAAAVATPATRPLELKLDITSLARHPLELATGRRECRLSPDLGRPAERAHRLEWRPCAVRDTQPQQRLRFDWEGNLGTTILLPYNLLRKVR